MRIGLDVDNVILDFDGGMLDAMLLEDKNKRNKGIINKNADYILSGMFDWNNSEIIAFMDENTERIACTLKPLEGAKYYMDKLLEEGHELILISNRAYPHYREPFLTTATTLKNNQINYTKLVITETNDKSSACLQNKVDILVDDRATNCYLAMKNNIKCCLMRSRYEKRSFTDLDSVSNWKELYYKIHELDA